MSNAHQTKNLIPIKRHSLPKYRMLSEYLHLLKLNPVKGVKSYYLVDAFAGTGEVYRTWDRKVMHGSSLTLAEFAGKLSDLPTRCISVEAHPTRYDLLKDNLRPYSHLAQCVCRDCNEEILNIFEKLSSDDFVFIFFDPDGLGDPPLQYNTVRKVLAHQNIETLLNFQWRAGLLRVLSMKTLSAIETATNFIGNPAWRDVMLQHLPSEQKLRQILKLYLKDFERRFPHIQYLEVPPNSKNPYYFLIFATDRQNVAEGMRSKMDAIRIELYKFKRRVL